MNEPKKQIIKTILDMSGKYAPYVIFTDWIEMCALSIQNAVCMVHGKIWQDREQLYIDLARKYTEKELEAFGGMLVLLCDALTEKYSDVLGEIYMEAGMGNKYTGQFFTPFHLSELCARASIDLDRLPETGHIHLNEPSSGGGGMVIAACKVLHDHGFDFQRRLDVVAQDLDWKGVYMTYLQLSLIGCRAIVVQGDTLTEPYVEGRRMNYFVDGPPVVKEIYPPERIMKTPAMMGLLEAPL